MVSLGSQKATTQVHAQGRCQCKGWQAKPLGINQPFFARRHRITFMVRLASFRGMCGKGEAQCGQHGDKAAACFRFAKRVEVEDVAMHADAILFTPLPLSQGDASAARHVQHAPPEQHKQHGARGRVSTCCSLWARGLAGALLHLAVALLELTRSGVKTMLSDRRQLLGACPLVGRLYTACGCW